MENQESCLKSVAVILPSLNPDHRFKDVVDGLVGAGFEHIIAVDDGSDAEHRQWFEEIKANPQCTVLVHEVNKGKGRALKDAIAYVHEQLPQLKGVVTIDGDGQHLLPDIIACADRMQGYELLQERGRLAAGCSAPQRGGEPLYRRHVPAVLRHQDQRHADRAARSPGTVFGVFHHHRGRTLRV